MSIALYGESKVCPFVLEYTAADVTLLNSMCRLHQLCLFYTFLFLAVLMNVFNTVDQKEGKGRKNLLLEVSVTGKVES